MKKNFFLLVVALLLGASQSWAQSAPVVDTLNFNAIKDLPTNIVYIKEDKVFDENQFVATVSPKVSGKDENCLWDDLVYGTQLRLYSGTITIEAKPGFELTKLEVEYDTNFGMTADCGQFEENIWTNNGDTPITKVVLTASKYNRLNKIFIGEQPLVLQSMTPEPYEKHYISWETLPEEVVLNFQREPGSVAYVKVAKHASLKKIDTVERTDITADAVIDGNSVRINMKNYYEKENPVFFKLYAVVLNKAGVACQVQARKNGELIDELTDTITGGYFTDIRPIKMDPEAGSTVTSLKDFALWVEKPYNIGGYDHQRRVTLFDEAMVKVCEGTVIWDDNEFNRLNVHLEQEVTASGKYTLHIPYEMYMSQKSFGVVKNKEQNYEFFIAASGVNVEAITPASFEETSTTMKQLPEKVSVVCSGDVGSVSYASLIIDGNADARIDIASNATIEGNVVTFDLTQLPEQQVAPLYYAISFQILDKEGNAIAYNHNENVGVTYYGDIAILKSEPEVGSTVEELSTVNIFVDDRYQAGAFEVDKTIKVLDDASGAEVTTATINFHESDWSCYVLTLEKAITESGTYTIVIPEATYSSNNLEMIKNKEEKLTYIVAPATGIDSVEADGEAQADVYTIDGIQVRKAGEGLKGLAKGVYVTGGKKIVVK